MNEEEDEVRQRYRATLEAEPPSVLALEKLRHRVRREIASRDLLTLGFAMIVGAIVTVVITVAQALVSREAASGRPAEDERS